MIQLWNKTAKRIVSFLFAAILLAASALMFTSCDSSWPKVTINISFNSKTYSIEYKLYRKFYPSTVRHFIELADAGFYDGLCFHDYVEDEGMYTGAYEYVEEDYDTTQRGLVEKDYYDWLEDSGVSLTETVYEAVSEGTVPDSDTALHTLVGEFEANGYTIENNDKNYGSKSEGGLVMYYPNIKELSESYASTDTTACTVKRNNKQDKTDDIKGTARWYSQRNYCYNTATSMFYISFENSSGVEYDECVFGELYDDDAEDEYDDLMDAIDDYIEENIGTDDEDEDDFTEETGELPAFSENDPYYGKSGLRDTYEVPVEPIVIKSIKVNRY